MARVEPFVPGQRYFSLAEPELGLGTVMRTEGRNVQVVFTSSGVVRQYMAASAPLTRADFKLGDTISGGGKSITVEKIEVEAGLKRYLGGGYSISEGELDEQQAITQADERLVSGRLDSNQRFSLRREAMNRRAAVRGARANGLFSAKVQLLPHQLRVVSAALARAHPRVLLADEVGLGKTIEASMILARMLASGRASRALIIVPEPLVVQWFVELMRRFNLKPAVFDEERAASIEASDPTGNPFQDDQLVLTDLKFLSRNAHRTAQVVAAGWDILIVDEAHHLEWSPTEISPQYQLVESLALVIPSVILLTATPEQLGRGGHFARLRLLDPARYSDLKHFETEADHFGEISKLVAQLDGGEKLTGAAKKKLTALLHDEPSLLQQQEHWEDTAVRSALIDALIDRHGTGRVMFRNRRLSVGGFPRRVAHLDVLPSAKDEELTARLLQEFNSDLGSVQPMPSSEIDAQAEQAHVIALTNDPRFLHLLQRLENISPAKAVLICRSARKVQLLEAALRLKSPIKVARFHEGLTLAQRDRGAAYFSDPEGAKLLLCSEIGSEGRNFQFAHHLLLWDLPLDPDLLEQRIGRLDRIGQTHEIEIHHAALAGSAQEALLRWHRDGIAGFTSSVTDGRNLLKSFGDELVAIAHKLAHGDATTAVKLEDIVSKTKTEHARLSALVNDGRDRLLELSSQRFVGGDLLQDELAREDSDESADDFVVQLFEMYGTDTEELAHRTFRFDPEYVSNDSFTMLGEEPKAITFDRTLALSRDELPLLRNDHPWVQAAVDLLLSGEDGNCACLVDPELPGQSVLLQCVFVLECVADKALHVEQYLPPQAVESIVDTKLAEREFVPSERAIQRADEQALDLAPQRRILATVVPPMLAAAQERAEAKAKTRIDLALANVHAELGHEIERLRALSRVNSAVQAGEIAALERQQTQLLAAIPQARVRLDALRLIVNSSFQRLR
jgi:ATP-dependent helicase HepA